MSLSRTLSVTLSIITSSKEKESDELLCYLPCAGNWLRTVTSDQTVHNNSSLHFSFVLVSISLDRNYWLVINLLLVLSVLYLKLKKYCNFGTKSSWRAWQEVNYLHWQLMADRNEWPNRTQEIVAIFLNSSDISLDRNYRLAINLLLCLGYT